MESSSYKAKTHVKSTTFQLRPKSSIGFQWTRTVILICRQIAKSIDCPSINLHNVAKTSEPNLSSKIGGGIEKNLFWWKVMTGKIDEVFLMVTRLKLLLATVSMSRFSVSDDVCRRQSFRFVLDLAMMMTADWSADMSTLSMSTSLWWWCRRWWSCSEMIGEFGWPPRIRHSCW